MRDTLGTIGTFALLGVGNLVYGQYEHNIQLNDGMVVTHTVTQIDSISFSESGTPSLHLQLMDGSSEAFDLDNIDEVTFSGTPIGDPSYPEGTVHCLPNGEPTAVVEVMNAATGKIWMDRNLGAAQAAVSATSLPSYGDLYQWGRFSDGHQCRTSETTSSISSSETPGHGDFILASGSPGNWLNEENDNLWQGSAGTNNPCPEGYRLPSDAEWDAEQDTWPSLNIDGAFASPLKLSTAGYRVNSDGNILFTGTFGIYWSSTVSGIFARDASFSPTGAFVSMSNRAFGYSVRCIKD